MKNYKTIDCFPALSMIQAKGKKKKKKETPPYTKMHMQTYTRTVTGKRTSLQRLIKMKSIKNERKTGRR